MYPPNHIYSLIQKLPFDRQDLTELPIEARTGRNWRYVYYREQVEAMLEAYRHMSIDAREVENKR